MKLNFRQAKLSDLDLLNHWLAQPHILETVGEWDFEEDLQGSYKSRQQLICFVDSIPIGFLQILDPVADPSDYWGDVEPGTRALDIWIGEVDYLRKGWGRKIMEYGIEKSFEDSSVHSILIDPMESNVNAIMFYKKLGFEFLEDRVLDGDKCAVYILRRNATT